MPIVFNILRVGFPSMLSQMSMSIAVFILNAMIIHIGGADEVAIYTGAWRILMFGIIPLLGISVGVTAVTGAAFGAKDINKLKTGYLFGVKIGTIAELTVAILVILFAHQLAFLFSYTKSSSHIAGPLARTLRILAIFVPTIPMGMLTSAMFNGVGLGERALTVMFLRTIIFRITFAYILGFLLHLGFDGILWGVVVGNILASTVAFIWGLSTIHSFMKKFPDPKTLNPA